MWKIQDNLIAEDCVYFEICKSNLPIYDDMQQWLIDHESMGDGSEDFAEEWEGRLIAFRHSGLTIIIFSAMCLEALINRYGINNTTSIYFKNYVDKLDVVSKWLLIPRLVKGQAIDPGSQPFEILKRLFKYRNKIVHYKSTAYEDEEKVTSEVRLLYDEFREEVANAVKAIIVLPAELAKIDPDMFGEYNVYDIKNEENEWLIDFM